MDRDSFLLFPYTGADFSTSSVNLGGGRNGSLCCGSDRLVCSACVGDFFSIGRDKGEIKKYLLPIPLALNSLCFHAINYACLYLLQI